MCGITGLLKRDEKDAKRLVEKLNLVQSHRGPDDSVTCRAGSFTLGNTRLAIQDLTAAGNQPFVSSDARVTCVFNGEIYNARELIQQHRLTPASRCDGAVLPELWRLYGAKSLAMLRGMFAIALVDHDTDTLVLARDPFGIKPLYLRNLPDGPAFASEPRALRCVPPHAEVRASSLASFLHMGALASDESPFEGVQAVPPNTYITIDAGGSRQSAPIDPSRSNRSDDYHGASKDLARALEQSVDLHLQADVPTALLLSAGVDSAAIASVARKLGRDLHCVTVSVAGLDDEGEGARRTATTYGHPHAVIPAVMDEEAVARFFSAMQKPSIDGLNTFLVSEAIRKEGYKVALSGLGGDEILGGYSHFKLLGLLPALRLLNRRLPKAMRAASTLAASRTGNNKTIRVLRGEAQSPWELDLLQRELFDPATVRELTGTGPPVLLNPDHESDGSSDRAFAQLVDAEIQLYLQRTLLPDADAFSMAHSLELRVPFVDKPFFEAAAGQARVKRRPLRKRDLADALGDPYLRQLTKAPKRGFTVPMAKWMSYGPLAPLVHRTTAKDAPIWDLMDRERGLNLLTKSPSRWSEVWSLVAFNGWMASLESQA